MTVVSPSGAELPPSSSPEEQPKKRTHLYAYRGKAYPRFLNSGLFRRLKWLVLALTLAVYWLSP